MISQDKFEKDLLISESNNKILIRLNKNLIIKIVKILNEGITLILKSTGVRTSSTGTNQGVNEKNIAS